MPLTVADLERVAHDVRDALRAVLTPAAQARLERGDVDPELRALTARAADLESVLDRRDGSAGWAAALSLAAVAYHDALRAAEAAAAPGPMLIQRRTDKKMPSGPGYE